MERTINTNFWRKMGLWFVALLILMVIGTLIINTAYAQDTMTWELWVSSAKNYDYWLWVTVRDKDSNIMQKDEYKFPGTKHYPDIVTITGGTTYTFQITLSTPDDAEDLWAQVGWMMPNGFMGIDANGWNGRTSLGIIIIQEEYFEEYRNTELGREI